MTEYVVCCSIIEIYDGGEGVMGVFLLYCVSSHSGLLWLDEVNFGEPFGVGQATFQLKRAPSTL